MKHLPDPCSTSTGSSSTSSIRRMLTIVGLALSISLMGCGADAAMDESTDPAVVDEGQSIVDILGVTPGMRVADVGAGAGSWTLILADAVGADGRVLATEVDEDDVDDLRQLAEDPDPGNLSVFLGSDTDSGLPDQCCDAILLRLVYHHFTDPTAMRASLRRSLRPGARLAIIDIEPQTDWRELDGVPDRGGHGIPMDDLITEMTADGFEVVESIVDWPDEEDHYCVVFRARE